MEPAGRNETNSCSPTRASGLSPAPIKGRTLSLPAATMSGSRIRALQWKRNPLRWATPSMKSSCANAPITYAVAITCTSPSPRQMIAPAANPFMTTCMAAGAKNEPRAFSNARKTSASATSGTTMNMIRESVAARSIDSAGSPGAVRRINGQARAAATTASPPVMASVATSRREVSRQVSSCPLRTSHVEMAGTSAWLAPTITMATSPSGMRAATKNASVDEPAPYVAAMATSSTRPDSTDAAAATLVVLDWRITSRDVRRGGGCGACISSLSGIDLACVGVGSAYVADGRRHGSGPEGPLPFSPFALLG